MKDPSEVERRTETESLPRVLLPIPGTRNVRVSEARCKEKESRDEATQRGMEMYQRQCRNR